MTLDEEIAPLPRKERFKVIDTFRKHLLADYGKTLMVVPDDEPRLKELQEANQSLDKSQMDLF
ncbi:hypothetical protein [Weissella viridescens]|uniref:hypothetical protein n=1 Tax=Weissella viridescens TaxID=1629 RepID=UPI00092EB939|nr:hypothetical protein [Weissella viridescens]